MLLLRIAKKLGGGESGVTLIADEQATAESLARSEIEYVKSQDYINYAESDHGEYEPDSAGSFEDNLSVEEPDDTLDGADAHMLNWELPSLHPEVSEEDPIATQTFYITGEEEQSGDYSWVVAKRSDVGEVGEIIGRLYAIESTAKVPGKGGEEIAKVEAYVLKEEEWEEEPGAIGTHIISWQITLAEKKGKK